MDICNSCGESSVERIDHNAEEQRVCTSCGVVQECGSFSTDAEKTCSFYVGKGNALFANQLVPKEIQKQSRKSYSEGLKEGFSKITVLSSQFRLTPEMKSQVFQMFKTAIATKELYMCRIAKKVLLAGCCVYVVMRQQNWPVTVSHVCNALGCTRVEFSEPYYTMVKVLNISISSTPIEELVDSYVDNCRAMESSEKAVLKSRVLNVLQISKDCWLTTGRMPRPILLTAIYLSWQSLDLKRSKVTFPAFCSKMGLTYQTRAGIRKCELMQVLCTLASKIPWFGPDYVTPRNLHKYLDDILKYSQTLMNDVGVECNSFRRFPEKDQTEPSEPCNGDEEISDKEIASYIRTEKEVNFIQKMNQTFNLSVDKS